MRSETSQYHRHFPLPKSNTGVIKLPFKLLRFRNFSYGTIQVVLADGVSIILDGKQPPIAQG